MDMDMDMDMDVDMDMDMDIDVYHRPNLELACNVGSRLFEQIILNFLLSIITVVIYCTVLYCTVLYCTGPYIAIHSHDVSMSIITAIIKMRKFADKQASRQRTKNRQTDRQTVQRL